MTPRRSAPPAEDTPSGSGELVARLRELTEAALRDLMEEELAGTPPAVADAVRYGVLSPGKRIRPLLLLGAYRAAGGQHPAAPRLACSVELVHAYSLVHDDLPCMDDDVLRRGRPTLHRRFGVPVAVHAGAALMPLAVRTTTRSGEAMGLPPARIRRLVTILSRASGGAGMVGGQLLDLRAEGREVSREELERIHRGKTAALMEAAVRMGGVAGGADEVLLERFGSFGRRLGLAFQAVDDILDVTASDRELGKTSGRDRELGKATYPSVLGLPEAEALSRELAERAREELADIERDEVLRAVASYVIERRR